MSELVVIAGPANSGKMALGRHLLAEDPNLVLVHRNHLRASFEINRPDEWHITLLTVGLVRGLLKLRRSALVVARNLEMVDRRMWQGIAAEFDVACRWLDVREPEVEALIPSAESASCMPGTGASATRR